MEIRTRNVNTLFSEMFWRLRSGDFVSESSRNGPVIRFPEPVLTMIDRPQERVLFHQGRDANPIFHLLEALWMLAGRRDVEFVSKFNSKIGQYSDDGEVFNAAYGHRMRDHFGVDQLTSVIRILRNDPTSRQAVVQLWDAADLNKKTLDKACNTQLVFSVNRGRLDLMVFNRSNDMLYGYAGANPVHFSVIQEFVAAAVGIPLGVYRTISNNLHLYTELYDASKYLESPPTDELYDAYQHGFEATPIITTDWERWLIDCEQFCAHPFNETASYQDPFFKSVAHPMAMISKTRKDKTGDGRYWVSRIQAPDWQLACHQWVDRREKAKLSAS
jgi:hypothetical protein